MDKKISIVIPAYNEGRYVAGALESVEAQRMDHDVIEVIVVDNASTDDTAFVCRSFFEKSSVRGILVHEPLLGPGRAKNRGAVCACGEVLLFLDADSRMEPTLAQRVYDRYSEGFEMGIVRIKADSSDGIANMYFDFIHWGKRLVHVTANMGYCCRDLFQRLGGFTTDLKHAEDLEFFTRAKKALQENGGEWCLLEDSVIFTSSRRMDRLPMRLGYPLTFLEWAFGGFLGFGRKKYVPYR
ncbi:MAG: glycosyltransferase [Spirochaetes bacterium]|nr:glycosyltransferase [Spirochaetota bacterium]